MKITIHPLFLAAGLLSALFGGLPIFIISALTALLHECGHMFYAMRLGFECKGIKLMPYGASAECDLQGISPADEIKLAMAGPLVNLVICTLCAGLWWFFPETYGYTDLIFYAGAAMLVLNLLPAYPLDGGRAAKCVLCKFLSRKALDITMRVLGALTAVGMILMFAFVLRNYTLIAVALFLLCSALEKKTPASRINFAKRKKKRGREIRYVILGEDATYRDALRFVDDSRYLVLQIYGEVFLDEITEDELYEKLQHSGLYERILS